jgi:signal peptidase
MSRRVARSLLLTVTVAGFSLAVLLLIAPRLLGYQAYVITGDSMKGTISRGSLVYAEPVTVDRLRVGDVITFAPPAMEAPVTHRIVTLRRADGGTLRIRTRGDNVGMCDPWTFVPHTRELPRYVVAIPWVGYAIAVFSLPLVRILIFVVPAALVALAVLVKLWREAGAGARRDEAAGTAQAALPEAGTAAR